MNPALKLVHWWYALLRATHLRSRAKVTIHPDGSYSIDKLDPGESVDIRIPIPPPAKELGNGH